MKEEESVLSVLMYLYHHFTENEIDVDLTDMQLIDELKSAGFHAHQIGRAFRWLHLLSEFVVQETTPSEYSFRVFTEAESQLLDLECRNFIIALENQGILSPRTREIVIHQAIELLQDGVDLHLLKWVTMMVLFNLPDSQEALANMESLVLSDLFNTVH